MALIAECILCQLISLQPPRSVLSARSRYNNQHQAHRSRCFSYAGTLSMHRALLEAAIYHCRPTLSCEGLGMAVIQGGESARRSLCELHLPFFMSLLPDINFQRVTHTTTAEARVSRVSCQRRASRRCGGW